MGFRKAVFLESDARAVAINLKTRRSLTIECWSWYAFVCIAQFINSRNLQTVYRLLLVAYGRHFYRRHLYTVSGEKGATIILPLTLPNADRFSKFMVRFHVVGHDVLLREVNCWWPVTLFQ